MKVYLFLISAVMFSSHAFAFDSVYTDPVNRLRWSKILPGSYTNGCVDLNGRNDYSKCTFALNPNGEPILDEAGNPQINIDDSAAAQACRAIGVRLPTLPEAESLLRSFEHTEKKYGPQVTAKGWANMMAVWKPKNNYFWPWTSSIAAPSKSSAYVFNGYIDTNARGYTHNVICVSN